MKTNRIANEVEQHMNRIELRRIAQSKVEYSSLEQNMTRIEYEQKVEGTVEREQSRVELEQGM